MMSAVLRLKFPPPAIEVLLISATRIVASARKKVALPWRTPRLPRGLLHAPDQDAPARARALDPRKIHPQLLCLAAGRLGGPNLGGVFGALVPRLLGRVLPPSAAF